MRAPTRKEQKESALKKVVRRRRRLSRVNIVFLILSLTSFVRIPSVLRKKRPRRIVPTARFKQIQLVRGPSIHVRAFHRRDVHA